MRFFDSERLCANASSLPDYRDDLQYDSEDDEVNSEWMALKNEMRSVGFVGIDLVLLR